MRRRSTLIILLVTFAAYLSWSVFAPFGSPAIQIAGSSIILTLLLAILWVPLVYWNQDVDQTTPAQRAMQWTAFLAMGWMSFVLVLSIARDLLSFWHPLRTAEISLILLVFSSLILLFGFFIANYGLKAKHVKVFFDHLPKEFHGFRIIQLSDIHVGPTIRGGFVKRMVKLVNAQNPDVIAITGDVADGIPSDLKNELEPFRSFRARFAKFYVTGNHEYYWDGPAWVKKMRELDFTPLQNESQQIRIGEHQISFSGINDPAATLSADAPPNFERARNQIPEHSFPRILLSHQPGVAKHAEKHGFDLQLSGHTHAGQFFPWTLVTFKLYGALNQGLSRIGKMQIYVNRGTGYWGPPVRLGSSPEITVIELGST